MAASDKSVDTASSEAATRRSSRSPGGTLLERRTGSSADTSLERLPTAEPREDPRAEAFHWFARGIGLALGVLLVLVIAFGAVLAARALLLVFAAILLGSALEPLVGTLRAHLPLGRGASVLLVYICFFAAVALVALLIVPASATQANELARQAPSLLARAHAWAANLHPQPLAQSVTTLIESAQGTLAKNQSPSTEVVVQAGLTVGQIAIAVGTLLAIVFFWLTEHARLQRYALSFVPAERRGGVRDAWNEVETRLGLWVRGELTLMATMGVMTGVLYTAIGLPTPLLLAVWAGFAEAIPIVGPLLGAVPAVVLAATVRPELVLVTLAVYAALQFVEGNVLVPIIMRNAIGISPFLVIVSLSIGAEVGGIPGAFLAVPVTAALEVVLERLQARDTPIPEDPSYGSPSTEESAEMRRIGPDAQARSDAVAEDRDHARDGLAEDRDEDPDDGGGDEEGGASGAW